MLTEAPTYTELESALRKAGALQRHMEQHEGYELGYVPAQHDGYHLMTCGGCGHPSIIANGQQRVTCGRSACMQAVGEDVK